MTTDHPADDDASIEEIRTDSQFNDVLRTLLVVAHDNGIDVAGGWDCRNGREVPDWDVEITELATSGEE